MIIASPPPSVPLFHSLGGGTMEQTSNQWNSPWNTNGTSPLKALANKILERNKEWNTPGTAASKSVPPMPQPSSACGTSSEAAGTDITDKCLSTAGLSVTSVPALNSFDEDALFDTLEERLAIAEYDGYRTPSQAQRIAYQDAFIAVLNILPQEDTQNGQRGDWLKLRIKVSKDWLVTQGLEQPE